MITLILFCFNNSLPICLIILDVFCSTLQRLLVQLSTILLASEVRQRNESFVSYYSTQIVWYFRVHDLLLTIQPMLSHNIQHLLPYVLNTWTSQGMMTQKVGQLQCYLEGNVSCNVLHALNHFCVMIHCSGFFMSFRLTIVSFENISRVEKHMKQ